MFPARKEEPSAEEQFNKLKSNIKRMQRMHDYAVGEIYSEEEQQISAEAEKTASIIQSKPYEEYGFEGALSAAKDSTKDDKLKDAAARTAVDGVYATLETHAREMASNWAKGEGDFTKDRETFKTELEPLDTQITAAQQKYNDEKTLCDADSARSTATLVELQKNLNILNKTKENLEKAVNKYVDDVSTYTPYEQYGLAKALDNQKAEASKAAEAVGGDKLAVETAYDNLKTAAKNMHSKWMNGEGELKEDIETLKAQLAPLDAQIKIAETKHEAAQAAYDKAVTDKLPQADVDTKKADLTKAEQNLKTLTDAKDSLEKAVTKHVGDVAKNVREKADTKEQERLADVVRAEQLGVDYSLMLNARRDRDVKNAAEDKVVLELQSANNGPWGQIHESLKEFRERYKEGYTEFEHPDHPDLSFEVKYDQSSQSTMYRVNPRSTYDHFPFGFNEEKFARGTELVYKQALLESGKDSLTIQVQKPECLIDKDDFDRTRMSLEIAQVQEYNLKAAQLTPEFKKEITEKLIAERNPAKAGPLSEDEEKELDKRLQEKLAQEITIESKLDPAIVNQCKKQNEKAFWSSTKDSIQATLNADPVYRKDNLPDKSEGALRRAQTEHVKEVQGRVKKQNIALADEMLVKIKKEEDQIKKGAQIKDEEKITLKKPLGFGAREHLEEMKAEENKKSFPRKSDKLIKRIDKLLAMDEELRGAKTPGGPGAGISGSQQKGQAGASVLVTPLDKAMDEVIKIVGDGKTVIGVGSQKETDFDDAVRKLEGLFINLSSISVADLEKHKKYLEELIDPSKYPNISLNFHDRLDALRQAAETEIASRPAAPAAKL